MYKPLQAFRKTDTLEDILVCLYNQISSHDETDFTSTPASLYTFL